MRCFGETIMSKISVDNGREFEQFDLPNAVGL